MASGWGRLQRAGAVALPVLSIGFLVLRGGWSQDVPFIRQGSDAPWIQLRTVVSGELHQWGHAEVPVASFSRVFTAGAEPVVLQVRALRRFSVLVNGSPVPGAASDGARWRDFRRFELPARRGSNELRIDVVNRHGPALLSARLETPAVIVTDGAWNTAEDGRPLGKALLADDTRVNPLALAVETPLEAVVEARTAVIAAFLLGVLAFVGAGRVAAGDAERLAARLPAVALGAAALGWVYLFFDKFLRIPLIVGFDARHHLHYIEFLREHHAVPLATDGWSVYHPPLFYALAAVLQWLGEAVGGADGAAFGLRWIPFAAGLGNVWVAGALGRRLAPDPPAARTWAIAFAAVLPMNLYSAAYFSNETFHTFVAGLALLVTVDLLLARQVSTRGVVGLAVLLGLCLVTKFTGLLVTAVAGFFLVVKVLALDRAAPRRAFGWIALAAPIVLAIAGWFYLRNWLEFGDPLMANWGFMPGPTLAWWQQPGFHTTAYFTGFGESLRHPYLSAFHSFWDSVYSTLWGDGGIAGRVSPLDRLSFWNYRAMSAGYLIALPATALLGWGAWQAAVLAFTDADPRRRAAFSFLLTFVYAVLFGLLYLALRLPYFAQGKASYGLVVCAPLALFFALGLTRCDAALARPGLRVARAVLYGWLAVFLCTMFGAYAL